MQKFIILVLLVLLGTGAFISRPTDPKKAFTDYLVDNATRGDKNIFAGSWDAMRAQRYADSCEYTDWYFWENVKHDGHWVYVNVFNNWFGRGEIRDDIQQLKQKANSEIGQTKDQLQRLNDPKSNLFQP